MLNVCLRHVTIASLHADGTALYRVDGAPDREIRIKLEDTSGLEFAKALRSSRVDSCALKQLVFTPELAAILLQTHTVIDALSIVGGSCAALTPAQLQKLILHLSPTSLNIMACKLRACQLTDQLIRALSKNRVRRIKFHNPVPVDGGCFAVTNDAIVDFCAQDDVPIGQEGDTAPKRRSHGELVVRNGRCTKDLFKRLVEASSMSLRTQSLRIAVYPLRFFEEEDLRDFAQHLSYRHRGMPHEMRVYDFPGDQHGASAAVHTQIVLHSDNMLELIRARRPSPVFEVSDE